MQNLKRKISKIYQNLTNKRHLRADVLSLLSSALRPRLFRDQSTPIHYNTELNNIHTERTIFGCNRGKFRFNVAKIVAFSTILGISGLFTFVSSSSVFADSLTLTIPSDPLSLDLNPTVNNGFATASGSFNVKTINSSGYTLSIKSKNEDGSNSLVSGESKLNSITETTSEDNFKNDPKFINMWGWLPNKLNSEDNTSYQIAPGTEEIVLDKTEEANEAGTDYNITLAAKVANDTPTGKYENTFVISATSNELPPDGIMQEWDGCDSLGSEQSVRLLDNRDNNVYTVAKLKDGKCWMTENLRITGDSVRAAGVSTTLDSANTDISDGNNFTIPDSDLQKFITTGLDTTASQNNDAVYIDHVTYEDPDYGIKNFDSGYYTWHTATAGSGTASMSSEGMQAPNSICPKGWKLPTGGEDGRGSDAAKLAAAYYITDSVEGSKNIRNTPPNYLLAGNVSGGKLEYQGSQGAYWNSTIHVQGSIYGSVIRIIGSSRALMRSGYGRSAGLSVRCLQRTKTISDVQYLQDWNNLSDNVKSQILDSMEEGDNYTLVDKRDNSQYTVAKLKDGNLWMTQNLKIVDKTISSADSDMASGSFTIPASDMSKFNVGSNGLSTTEGKNNDAAYVETVSYSDPTYGAKSFESGYYTWHTATAGTGTADQTTKGWNAPSSICPKGWKLPTGGEGGDFQTLTNAYSISSNTDGSNILRGNPLNFTYAGFVYYRDGSMSLQGSNGAYWSSTVDFQGEADILTFGSGRLEIPSNRPNGFSVRCVARIKRPENKGTMQTVDQWGDSVQEGETVFATDSRDNSIYTVARLKDGKLWMTQNLRIIDKTITPTDSDVTNSYTIPSSALWTADKWANPDDNRAYYANDTNSGAYYTWYTATAGTGNSTLTEDGQDAPSSICPKGWRLPTAGNDANSDFQILYNYYSLIEQLVSAPASFVRAGWLATGQVYSQDVIGYYWSSTVDTRVYAYAMHFSSSGRGPSSREDRPYGLSVRCIARDKTP